MANTKSAKKRVRQTAKITLRNRARKSQVKTALKKAYAIIQNGTDDAAGNIKESVSQAISVVMTAASKGVIHKNNAAKKVSRLAKALNSATGSSTTKTAATPKKTTVKKKSTAKKVAKKKTTVKKKKTVSKKKS